ncbi:hypothetical protein AX660_03070 [Paraglaciecola hydrolytica]|uniref:Sialidase domain-containing protein n=2 Tax=Paraglaciecola hydrolytica TaxID=1799789 RepID=A0A148KKX6_9ALTE|nr:hypothetical protein AX660_03070 [Paraglaciecola hydrolytica]
MGLHITLVDAAQKPLPLPFDVKAQLFDLTNDNTRGLDFAPNIESFEVFVAQQHTNKYNHGAVLMPFKGELYIQWQSSALDEDAADTSILFSKSQDSKNWQTPLTLVAARENAIVTNGGWWTNGEELIAFINVWPSLLQPKQGYVEYISSTDGSHWSQPQRLKMANGDWVAGVIEQDLRQLPNGRILTTVHAQPGLIATPYYTDDPLALSGWTAGKIPNLPHTGTVSRELEPSWFVKKDRSIVMIFRDQASSYKTLASVSTDNGQNWSAPALTALPDSRAKQSAGNLPDGSAFIINNPSADNTRIPLAITLSADGSVFDRSYLLRAGGEDLPPQKYQGKYKRAGYSYPKSIVWKNFVYVSYAVNKEDIVVTRAPLNSLLLKN